MVMVMDTATMDIMARGRLMLSPGIIIMVTDTLMVDMAITVTMARGSPRLPLVIIMDILMVMSAMDTTVTMARGKLMLSQDTIITVMAMDMVDMDTMVTIERGRLMPSQDTITMDMVMDTTVNKQHLFISFQNSVTSIGTCWNLVNRNT